MKLRAFTLVSLFLLSSALWSSDWQIGRIQSVKKDVASKVLYYVVNTPVTEDVVTYTVSVHTGNLVITGTYDEDKLQSAPPDEWTESTPVWVRLDDKTMYLKGATSPECKLSILKRKASEAMPPLTREEIKAMNAAARPEPVNSPVGFGAKEAAAAQEASVPKPEPTPPGGTVNISTVPYLADIFVDGKDMGYSPVKIHMSPGKHMVRVSKAGYRPVAREVMVAADSQQDLDITLEKKP